MTRMKHQGDPAQVHQGDPARKKKVLFVIDSLTGGGAEKSLISLLGSLDYSLVDVSLQVFRHSGLFQDLVPLEVKRLDIHSRLLTLTHPPSALMKLAIRHPAAFFRRAQAALYIRTRKMTSNQQVQSIWRWWKKAVPADASRYDAVVGYLQTTPLYYAVDKVKAETKIGWFHSDYASAGYSKELDAPYFKALDAIVTVSDSCMRGFLASFPEHRDKTHVIENIISERTIRNLADSPGGFTDGFTGIRILTVARMTREKGVDLAVEACRELTRRKHDFRWYVIGRGDEIETLQGMIREYGLFDRFYMLGEMANPYPFFKQADIYVQPSRYEGKCIAVEEAKILCKPMVVTAYKTVTDQVENNVTGLVARMDGSGIADEVERLLTEPWLGSFLADQLSRITREGDAESSMRTFYSLIGL